LFKRQFLRRKGKTILATSEGKSLINALPESASWPDMTAQWESQLDAILQRQQRYQDFMTPLSASLSVLVEQAQQASMESLRGLGKAPRRASKGSKTDVKKRRSAASPKSAKRLSKG